MVGCGWACNGLKIVTEAETHYGQTRYTLKDYDAVQQQYVMGWADE